jgi:hypothetical protein
MKKPGRAFLARAFLLLLTVQVATAGNEIHTEPTTAITIAADGTLGKSPPGKPVNGPIVQAMLEA